MELKPPLSELPRKKRKLKIFFGLVFVLIIYGLFHWFNSAKEEPAFKENIPTSQETPIEPEEKMVSYKVAEGDIPAEVFSAQGGWDANDTEALLIASKNIFDFTHIKIGQPLRFYFDQEEKRAKRLEYERNTETLIIVERQGDDFSVREEKIAYEVSQKILSATIDNFFYVDALSAGMSEPTVLEMSDIFAFNIDFTTEIRQGDQFTVIYEKQFLTSPVR